METNLDAHAIIQETRELGTFFLYYIKCVGLLTHFNDDLLFTHIVKRVWFIRIWM